MYSAHFYDRSGGTREKITLGMMDMLSLNDAIGLAKMQFSGVQVRYRLGHAGEGCRVPRSRTLPIGWRESGVIARATRATDSRQIKVSPVDAAGHVVKSAKWLPVSTSIQLVSLNHQNGRALPIRALSR